MQQPSSIGVGTRVGPFEVEAKLGAGGMGEVYRARDTRLNRVVAIKFLTAGIADEQSRRRFQQEAKTASALNHPHIVTVFEVGDFAERDYLVTEFVEGGTLSDWARTNDRAWRRVVELLVGVADGLAAAHEAGILHRDIKPDNILVTRSGSAKLADFGVAKLVDRGAATTLTRTVEVSTTPGVVIGTVAYMSPEQATGDAIDARSDLFSFGVVLFELLAGKRPFEGATDLDRLHALVHRSPPPLGDLRPDLPTALTAIVDKALEKDPADRYQSARDLVVDLRRLLRRSEELAGGGVEAQPKTRRLVLYAAGVAVLLLVAAAAWVALTRARPPASAGAPPIGRPEPITAFSDFAVQPAFSPDGRMLTFIRGPSSFTTPGQVYVKLLPNGEPVQLTNDPMLKMMPQFSPDGSRVVYTVNTDATASWDTWVVPVLGGEPRLWLPNASGLQWIGPQRLLFSEIKSGVHMALVSSTESRTESRDIYVPQSNRGMVHRSYASPDRKHAIVVEMDSTGMLPCRLVALDGQSTGRAIGPPNGRCTHAAWSPDGQWMYLSSNAGGSFQLWRQRYPDGAPEQLTFPPTQAEGIAIAPDGRSIVTSIGLAQRIVRVVNGTDDRQVSGEGDALLPAWGDGFPTTVFSPNADRLYYLVQTGERRGFGSGELWSADLARGTNEAVLPGLAITSFDISSDGERVVFAAIDEGGTSQLWIARLDRRSPPRRLSPEEGFGPVFGRAGEVYYRGSEHGLSYIYELAIDSGQRRKFTAEQAVNSPIISPDGQWILSWVPDEGKSTTTVLKAFPKAGGAPITICPRCYPKWTRDQKYLFFSFLAGTDMDRGDTFVLRVPPGKAFPPWPAAGVESDADLRRMPHLRVIDRPGVFPGTTPDLYAYRAEIVRRNLYRITLPQ